MFLVYQLGRGNDPVMVVGSLMSLVARSIVPSPSSSMRGLLPAARRSRADGQAPIPLGRWRPDFLACIICHGRE
jgi:hypothetical protein